MHRRPLFLWSVFAPLSILGLLFLNQPLASADDFTSSGFIIRHPVINVAGYSSSDNFRLISTIGQTATGISTASSGDTNLNTLKAGFLYFSEPAAVAPTPTPTPAPAPTVSGGGPILEKFKKFLLRLFCKRSDLNCDSYVNIYDAGILFYWWEKQVTKPTLASLLASVLRLGRPSPDINSDQGVDIFDLSIMLSDWTNNGQ